MSFSTADGDAAASFYGELFGWETVSGGPPEQTGGYRMFMQDGKAVAGLMAQDDVPTVWSTYFSVDDADTAAAQIGEAGGTTQVGPLDVMDLGRMGFFSDPGGAMFGIWQPGTFAGTELEPGTVGVRCWSGSPPRTAMRRSASIAVSSAGRRSRPRSATTTRCGRTATSTPAA